MIKVDENILYGGYVMTNERNRKHKKRKKEAEINFFATKATFVAGIVVLITIVKDILELCIQIPVWVVILYLSICFIVYIVVLCTTIVDKKMRSKGVANFGNFLTIFSIIVFIIENSVIRFADTMMHIEAIIIVSASGVVAIIGALYLFFAKYND